jgi:hypothetical protein
MLLRVVFHWSRKQWFTGNVVGAGRHGGGKWLADYQLPSIPVSWAGCFRQRPDAYVTGMHLGSMTTKIRGRSQLPMSRIIHRSGCSSRRSHSARPMRVIAESSDGGSESITDPLHSISPIRTGTVLDVQSVGLSGNCLCCPARTCTCSRAYE